jgi:hypothetical protein
MANKRPAKWLEIEHPSIYANMLGIGMTAFDINIIFGEIIKADPSSVTGTPKVKIILAPEQAQNLIKLLTVAINSYAKANGPLRSSGSVDVEELTENFEASRLAGSGEKKAN